MKSNLILWFALFAIVITAFMVIAIPVELIKPFSPQKTGNIATSFLQERWSPFVTNTKIYNLSNR